MNISTRSDITGPALASKLASHIEILLANIDLQFNKGGPNVLRRHRELRHRCDIFCLAAPCDEITACRERHRKGCRKKTGDERLCHGAVTAPGGKRRDA